MMLPLAPVTVRGVPTGRHPCETTMLTSTAPRSATATAPRSAMASSLARRLPPAERAQLAMPPMSGTPGATSFMRSTSRSVCTEKGSTSATTAAASRSCAAAASASSSSAARSGSGSISTPGSEPTSSAVAGSSSISRPAATTLSAVQARKRRAGSASRTASMIGVISVLSGGRTKATARSSAPSPSCTWSRRSAAMASGACSSDAADQKFIE